MTHKINSQLVQAFKISNEKVKLRGYYLERIYSKKHWSLVKSINPIKVEYILWNYRLKKSFSTMKLLEFSSNNDLKTC